MRGGWMFGLFGRDAIKATKGGSFADARIMLR